MGKYQKKRYVLAKIRQERRGKKDPYKFCLYKDKKCDYTTSQRREGGKRQGEFLTVAQRMSRFLNHINTHHSADLEERFEKDYEKLFKPIK